MNKSFFQPKLLFFSCLLIVHQISCLAQNEAATQGISIYDSNPWYWQYNGKPVVLIGGSNEDNPYQWTGKQLTDHLDLMAASGGNYIRNTMSDRDDGNIYAFKEIKNGTYDLTKWNDDFWGRLNFFLEETAKRDIVVQLTLWDHFDIGGSRWQRYPWNPARNVNLEKGELNGREDFYAAVDDKDEKILSLQETYINQLLEVTLNYNHVLYNINNESSESGGWENYWAGFVKEKAKSKGREAYVTNMQLSATNAVRHIMTYGDIFDFVDISQVNQDSKGARGPAHWDYLMFIRDKIASYGPMPMNNIKIYGATDGSTNFSAGSETEAIDRFWRDILGGCATARFHRPSVPHKRWGSGINERVQTNLKAMTMLLEKLDIFNCVPRNDLLSPEVSIPSMMEAYVSAKIGSQYAVYFPQGRFKVNLDPWVFADEVSIQWLDINNLKWSETESVKIEWDGSKRDWGYRGKITLETPSNGPFVALLEIKNKD